MISADRWDQHCNSCLWAEWQPLELLHNPPASYKLAATTSPFPVSFPHSTKPELSAHKYNMLYGIYRHHAQHSVLTQSHLPMLRRTNHLQTLAQWVSRFQSGLGTSQRSCYRLCDILLGVGQVSRLRGWVHTWDVVRCWIWRALCRESDNCCSFWLCIYVGVYCVRTIGVVDSQRGCGVPAANLAHHLVPLQAHLHALHHDHIANLLYSRHELGVAIE